MATLHTKRLKWRDISTLTSLQRAFESLLSKNYPFTRHLLAYFLSAGKAHARGKLLPSREFLATFVSFACETQKTATTKGNEK